MHLSRQKHCRSLRCSWSIACRRCSNYIFILDLTPGFIGLGKDNCKTRWETFKFVDLVCLILEILYHYWWLLSSIRSCSISSNGIDPRNFLCIDQGIFLHNFLKGKKIYAYVADTNVVWSRYIAILDNIQTWDMLLISQLHWLTPPPLDKIGRKLQTITSSAILSMKTG